MSKEQEAVEYIKQRFVRLANKTGFENVTSDNFEEEMPYSMFDCYEHIINHFVIPKRELCKHKLSILVIKNYKEDRDIFIEELISRYNSGELFKEDNNG